ncbi:hypothetical protein [Streptomyces sp. NPDC051180]|uniref:hypothetical protein n=1 Tax=unclassified Streptomyces TaxID=2593676 RepID=UPI00344D923E
MALALSLISAGEAGLLIPAGEVTALLRQLADDGAGSLDESGSGEEAARTLVEQLLSVADQLDAECIAFLPPRDESS